MSSAHILIIDVSTKLHYSFVTGCDEDSSLFIFTLKILSDKNE